MMRFSAINAIILASVGLVTADVSITVPAAQASVPAAGFSVTWISGGDAPAIADITGYALYLYTGSNTAPVIVGPVLASGTSPTPSTIQVKVTPTLGGETKNAYFLGMVSTTAGGTVTNYSKRFTITGMTGTFSPALGTITGTDGPTDLNNIAAGSASTVVGGDPYAIPFNLQSGPTRYAAMQPVPGTKITATNTAPLFPTSPVTFAKTALPMQTSIVTTQTMAQTFSVKSHANTASPAPMPSNDMQRFLNRWKD